MGVPSHQGFSGGSLKIVKGRRGAVSGALLVPTWPIVPPA